ncbi:SIS domain-containing protein [Paracoccus sp. PAMC 22219]|uniref:SIS domain-containing protein n=1 Tax=Paracoccus sp. PAMC 22219 TaxID=1569209 RepID=UPI0005A75E4B|nr:SIS domain-containing protein [Paracoccus sp. PAMC 22219]
MTDFTARLRALTAEPSRDDARNEARLGRVQRTRDEMGGQGKAIRDTLASAAPGLDGLARMAADTPFRHIAVFGCGDSWFAGMAMRHAMETASSLPVLTVQALDHAHYPSLAVGQGTLAIGISSGGNTPAVMQAVAAAARQGAITLGLTNTEGSPITHSCDLSLIVQATRRGWPTQATSATMALLVEIAARIGRAGSRAGLLDELAGVIDAQIDGLDSQCRSLAGGIASANLVLTTGLGPNYAAASIGAAKIRELSPIHAFALPLEEVHHYRSFKRGDPVIVIATDPAARERALDTVLVAEDADAPVIAILSGAAPAIETRAQCLHLPNLPEGFEPLVSIAPLHLLAYHLAVIRAERGLGAPLNLIATP